MPTPEREVEPREPRTDPPSPAAVSMKDLLASCAAATAVSTPPREEPAAAEEDEGETREPVAGRDAA
ncbi:hypothetical protein OG909_19935 [Streptomyces sp. NBC_01754]|uniref:hypothetical protein n=1 Tax=Streptomyces sp. NBC_01754 TaxID=2975930 RepID=UPI002DDC56E4|nr:hypothetical protein [Streptomyces sp. NBC_01754]WSC94356.1 hypothetical protein OG909_19935 [Streptomyces sp. NBC_01754]